MEPETELSLVAASVCRLEKLELEERTGGGAFKQVFRVRDTAGSHWALKIVKFNDPHTDARTMREVEALSKCDHPNIARLHKADTHTCEGERFRFIMEEYLSGGTLGQRLETRGLMSSEQARRLGAPLIDAIAHVAELGLVHRDIKPANIMFRDAETPVLVDFGIARDLSATSLTLDWQPRGPGTPYYAAPEQLCNEKRLISWRTDQFALGVVLSLCRFGWHPYQHPNEPHLSAQTVARVAQRGHRRPEAPLEFQRAGLPCLDRMTRAWPVERFRRPLDLIEQWRQQGG
jgi:serine/threonine protein kinase